MIIVLIGPPGSGKGTQGKLLAEKLALPHVSIGNIFRDMVEAGNEEGQLLQDFMSKGKLVPTELVNIIVQKFLSTAAYDRGYVLDGYPRNLEQARFLEDLVDQEIKILLFDIENKTIIKRVLGRFNCINCGQIYNQFFIKPKIENICDLCGSNQFAHRQDDDEDTVRHRLEEYQIETYPLINYYKDNKQLYTVNANQNKEDIELFIDKLLKIV